MYYVEYVTKAKLPEYHLHYKSNQKELKEDLQKLGFNFKDFTIINQRGYEQKAVIRLNKAKIKKSEEAFKIIKKYLISKKQYSELSSLDKMYYPMLKNI